MKKEKYSFFWMMMPINRSLVITIFKIFIPEQLFLFGQAVIAFEMEIGAHCSVVKPHQF